MRLGKGRALQSGFFSLASCEPQRKEDVLRDSNPAPFFGICCNLHKDVSIIILIRFTSPSKFVQESSKFPPIKSQQLGTAPLLSQELDPGKKEGKRGGGKVESFLSRTCGWRGQRTGVCLESKHLTAPQSLLNL